jgi:hypothetical protein
MENKRTRLSSYEALRLMAWLNQAHPEIFKEFLAVNDVINKANEQEEKANEPR